jgi:hypothetical protein
MIKTIGIREFRDHATQYLASQDVLAVKRHNQIIGFYVPAHSTQAREIGAALSRLERSLEQLFSESGLDEESLALSLDLSHSDQPDAPSR